MLFWKDQVYFWDDQFLDASPKTGLLAFTDLYLFLFHDLERSSKQKFLKIYRGFTVMSQIHYHPYQILLQLFHYIAQYSEQQASSTAAVTKIMRKKGVNPHQTEEGCMGNMLHRHASSFR